MSEVDYARLERELDGGKFEAASATLGVELTKRTWSFIRRSGYFPGAVLALIRRALVASSGFAYERQGAHLLAVRTDDAVAFGAKRFDGSKKLGAAWPELDGWSPKVGLNDALRKWSSKAARDRVRLTVRDDFRVARDSDEERQFIDAIVRSPDDDELRLAYADWLEERGDVRSEFIRLQLEAAASPDVEGSNAARIDDILHASWRNFAGELAPWCSQRSFSRGLVEKVIMTPAAFVKHGDWVFSQQPVQTLQVPTPFTAAQLEQAVNAPTMSRVRGIEIWQNWTRPPLPVAALASGHRFDALRELFLLGCGRDGEDWSALFSRLEAPSLRRVCLRMTKSHSALWLALSKNDHCAQLDCIIDDANGTLAGSTVEEFRAAMKRFAKSRDALTHLDLGDASFVTDASLAPLLSPSSRVALRTLKFRGDDRVTDATLRNLVKGRSDELRSLGVGAARFTPAGVAKFVDALPPKLESFRFAAMPWNDEDLKVVHRALLRLPVETSLKKFRLPGDFEERSLLRLRESGP